MSDAPSPSAPGGASGPPSTGRGGIPGLSIRRPVTVMMSLAALLVVGYIAQTLLPVQLLPTGFDPPFMWVSVPTLPGAPADNERAVALPVEDGLGTLPGLSEQRTFVRTDSVGFMIRLDEETDVDTAYQQVRDRLDRVLPTLPPGSNQAFIWRHDPNTRPVAVYGFTYPPETDDPHHALESRLGRAIERIPGVSQVQVWGVPSRQVRIEIDGAAARAHRVDTGAIVRMLEQDNFTLALGAVEGGQQRQLVRALSRFEGLETIRQLPVAEGLKLSDVARVFYGSDPEPIIHRLDGAPAASLGIFKEATANTVATCAAVAKTIATTLATDPELAKWRSESFFDQGALIAQSIDQLRVSALYGGLIAVGILFIFLRSFGLTLLVTVAIPLCLLATVVVLFFKGDSLNVMSMMGLMLSVGMVIDNAIVVLENIDRHRRLGYENAPVTGAREVSLAITLATLTTMVVFLPIVLLGGSPMIAFYLGKVGFPVCYALLASLFVALVYIPSGTHVLGKRFSGTKPLGPVFRFVQNTYGRMLGWCLGHRTATTLIVVGCIASTAIPFGGVKRVDQVDGGLDTIDVRVNAPPQATTEEADAVLREFERRVLAEKDALEIRAVQTEKSWRPNSYSFELYLVPPGERQRKREELTKRLEELFVERPGYRFRIGWGRGGGGGQSGGLAMQVTGPDTQVAAVLAQEIVEVLERSPKVTQAEVEETEETIELQFRVDPDRAERAGLSAMAIGSTIGYTLQGRRIGELQTPERPVELRIGIAPNQRSDVNQINQMPVRSTDGAAALASLRTAEGFDEDDGFAAGMGAPLTDGVPLERVATAEQTPGYGQIRRQSRRSMVTVRVLGDEQALFAELQRVKAGIEMPTGYRIELGERFRNRRQNEEGGQFAVLMAVAMVFFLMGVLFESFILPFSILLTIPLAFCGVFWTLFITDTSLDIMAIIGCIILVGVVVNNGIVLIDQVQQRRTDGETRTEALVSAGRDRVRPILMTAMTTIGGLIPMATGKASMLGIEYAPLGRVVIGGLLTGTVLTLFAVPLFYALLDDLRHLPRRARLVVRRGAAGGEVVPVDG